MNCKKFVLLLAFLLSLAAASSDEYVKRREEMVREIQQEAQADRSILRKATLDQRVLEAMRKVPRHEFVPQDQKRFAYENRPLPIGYGQTISQPYIVAIMTDLLKLEPQDRVLEIGTGSGYQAAILAELVSEVYTIEIIGGLASQAKQRFQHFGYSNIQTRHGDGYYGWAPAGSFDAIMVTAAADHIPPPLIKQLKPEGRMLIPVGGKFTVQQLVLVEKDKEGKTKLRQILPVQFVPLTRGG
jgi:protein-L-isoaspartate(D-aspartate) O-methyltransferase